MAFWAIVILVPVIFFQLTARRGMDAPEIAYTDFVGELERNNIRAVEIENKSDVRGEFRAPVRVNTRDVLRFSVQLPFEASEAFAARLREQGVPIRAKKPRQGFFSVFVTLLPWLVLIGFWLFMFRQVQAGSGRAFAFGKSKAKLLTGDTPKLTFVDVAGADEAKVELQEIIEFLKDPQKFTRLGGRLPKGALLVGPPGTGKTLLAKAVAGEAGRPFFSMSGSDFVEMFVGVGASRVRDLFEQGKAHAPCIIFIDEIDAVGRHRGAGLGGGNDEREQTLNQLLVEMDGFEANEGVILIAATNRPDVLDPALLRPGRFDRQVIVPNPDIGGREKILKVHMRKVPLAPDVDPRVLARGTPGFSGADLANLVNEAALRAARVGKRLVTMADFEYAKDKVLMGTERRSMAMTDEEKKLTAYHEAGHALVALHVPKSDPLHKVTIIPRGRALGVTMQLPERDHLSHTKLFLESRLAILFGGRIAEEIIFGPENVTTGAASDIGVATQMARGMITAYGMSDKLGRVRYQANEQEVFLGHAVTQTQNVSEATAQIIDQEVRRLIEEAEGQAKRILTEHLDDLHAIAKALLEYESLSNDEIDQVLRGEKIVRDETGGAGSGPDRRRRASVPTSSGQNPGTSPGANPEPQPGV
ncbi:MAG TPA: ATP-dependent zinc metalloprotease FtsH [Reyranella sp.]|nr:ATP-dependent zinc metalloprotease FtsH [Reyranella sp.]